GNDRGPGPLDRFRRGYLFVRTVGHRARRRRRVNLERLEAVLRALYRTDQQLPVLGRLCIVSCERADAQGAGISRFDGAAWGVLASSDDAALRLERAQAAFGEGPCVESATLRQPSPLVDLASPDGRERWPRFARAAADEGVRAAFAFP